MYIASNSSGRRNSIMGPACFHQFVKTRVINNAHGSHAFCDPLNTLHPVGYQRALDNMKSTNLVSLYVCWRDMKVTFPLPCLSNTAVIVPFSSDFAPSRPLRTSEILLVSSARSTISVPQHCFACFRRLLVDFASVVSRKRRTMRGCGPFPLHWGAAHLNSWQRRPFMVATDGRGWKKA
jgi:hypothetical protein